MVLCDLFQEYLSCLLWGGSKSKEFMVEQPIQLLMDKGQIADLSPS